MGLNLRVHLDGGGDNPRGLLYLIGFRSRGKPRHLETRMICQAWNARHRREGGRIAARVQRHPPRGCLPRPIRLSSESVLLQPERGPGDPSAHELSARLLVFSSSPLPGQHLFPVAWKNKVPNFR